MSISITAFTEGFFSYVQLHPTAFDDTEKTDEKQTRYETTPTETGILDPDSLAHIFSFLSLQTQGQVARLSHSCRDAMRLRRVFDLDPLYGSRFSLLFPLFGITLPPPNPSSSQVSAACKELLEKVSNILEGVKRSKALTDEEKKPFSTMGPLGNRS